MTTESDKALSLLLDEASKASVGTEQDKESFDTFLTQMASADNPDPNFRQAAIQMRLPDVKVDRNDSGNLSFSARSQLDPTIPKDFQTKRVHTLDSNVTTIVGEAGEVDVLNIGTPSFQDQAKRAEMFHSTSNRSTANLLNQLTTIDGMGDTKERERALIDLTTSIDLALNDRKLELIDQAGVRFDLSNLERRLKEAEAADRADPRWGDFQHDSPQTSQIRKEVEAARRNATDEAERSYLTDTVANELTSRKKQSAMLLQADTDSMTPEEKAATLFANSYGAEDKSMARSFFEADQGRKGTDQEVMTYVANNKTLQGLLQGDQEDVLVHMFTEGTTNSAVVRQAVYAQEVNLVGAEVAERRIKDLDTTYKRLLAVVQADESELSQYTDLANIDQIQALRAEHAAALGIASTKSAKEQAAFKNSLAKRLMQAAQGLAQANEINHFFTSTEVDYPTATDPSIQSIITEARQGKQSVDWVIQQAEGDPARVAAVRAYLTAMFKDKHSSVLLGNASDLAYTVDTKVNARLMGQSGESIVMPRPSNLDMILEDIKDVSGGDEVLNTVGQGLEDAFRTGVEPMLQIPTAPFMLIDWLQAPAEGDNK